MAVEVWDSVEFLKQVREHADKEFGDGHTEERSSWVKAVNAVLIRAHERGDGVAVYENSDLGHPEIGQWQIASYGGPDAQLETREDYGQSAEELSTPDYFTHGEDTLRTTLPDIGGHINWRYSLKAIVPSYEQDAKANEFGTPGYSAVPPHGSLEKAVDRAIASENANPQGLPAEDIAALSKPLNDPTVDCCGRDAADCDCSDEEEQTYKIVRFYRDNRPKEVINTGFTLEQAQTHCNDEKTHGVDWFDGYEAE